MTQHASSYEHWQAKLGVPSGVVTGFDDLEQGIKNVINTQIGSVPGYPEFGCNHDLFRDIEYVQAARAASVHLHDALTRWCVRLVIERVVVEPASLGLGIETHCKISVFYGLKDSINGTLYEFTFPPHLGGLYAEL